MPVKTGIGTPGISSGDKKRSITDFALKIMTYLFLPPLKRKRQRDNKGSSLSKNRIYYLAQLKSELNEVDEELLFDEFMCWR